MRSGSILLRMIPGVVFGVSYLATTNVCAQVHEQGTSVISVPEQTDVTLNFAATELSKYLKRMTEQDYPVTTEAQPGDSPLFRLKVDTQLKHDGYRIYRDGDCICIFGGSSRGCLYGVYTLLVELGCKFPAPGKEYEIIPRLEKISWSGPTIQSEPAIAGRGILICPLNDAVGNQTREIAKIASQSELFYFHPFNVLDEILELIDWMAKNRFNFLSLYAGKIPSNVLPKLKEAFAARDMGLEWGMHWLPKYLPRGLFEEHPEYFRMEDGKRTPKLNMCPSSSEAADIIAKNSMKDWNQLRDFPRFETLHLWPDDLNPKVHRTSGWCSCEKCKGLTNSDQALKIINEVARRLPLGDTTIAHVSYHATIRPPKNIKPDDNVRLLYAPRERCYKHALDECQVNRKYLGYLKEQIQMFPNEPEIFEYYNDMILFRALPMPLHPIIGKDTKVYREAGAVRILALSFVQFSKWAYGPNFYVLGKCLWRGDADPRDMAEYCDALYGPHAKAMKQYFDLLFEFCATVMQVCGYEMGTVMRHPPGNQPYTKTHVALLAPLITDEHLDKIEGLLREAIACAQEPYRTRIENQLLIWNFARIEVPTIYRTLLADYLKSNLGQDATDIDRLYVIALIKKVIQDMDKASEILLSAPEELRGTLYRDKGSMWRRFEGPKKSLCSWMEGLEKP